jgi:hypothetical protein
MEYRFFIDEKVTAWRRTEFTIQADTEEQANEQAEKFVENEEHFLLSGEVMLDTIEVVPDVWELYINTTNSIIDSVLVTRRWSLGQSIK